MQLRSLSKTFSSLAIMFLVNVVGHRDVDFDRRRVRKPERELELCSTSAKSIWYLVDRNQERFNIKWFILTDKWVSLAGASGSIWSRHFFLGLSSKNSLIFCSYYPHEDPGSIIYKLILMRCREIGNKDRWHVAAINICLTMYVYMFVVCMILCIFPTE